MPHTDPGATPAKPQGSSPNALDTPLTDGSSELRAHTHRGQTLIQRCEPGGWRSARRGCRDERPREELFLH